MIGNLAAIYYSHANHIHVKNKDPQRKIGFKRKIIEPIPRHLKSNLEAGHEQSERTGNAMQQGKFPLEQKYQ